MEKGGKALKDQDKRNSSQKDEVAKTGWSGFLRTDRVRLGFEI
jgi:hypothetical protein